MKKNYVFVCIFFAAVALYAGGKKDNLSFIGQTGNYSNAAKVLSERLAQENGSTPVDIYDVAYASLHESIMLDLSGGSGSYDLVMTNASWLEECSQYFMDLTPFVKEAGIDLSQFSKRSMLV